MINDTPIAANDDGQPTDEELAEYEAARAEYEWEGAREDALFHEVCDPY